MPMSPARLPAWLVLTGGLLTLGACEGSSDSGGATAEDTQPQVQEEPPLASCSYRNAFSSEPECKQYDGSAWTLETAAQDCETGIVGGAGEFSEATACALAASLGTCTVDSDEDLGYSFQIGGDDAAGCDSADLACTNFAGGTFEPTGVCRSGSDENDHVVFIWPYESCEQPLEGEEPGEGPDGEVCTWNLISGCTEEGRKFQDYGSCDVVLTNRPYYPVDPYDTTDADDPRLADDAYMAELDWVTSQVESCACVCCHTSDAPEGASIWGVDAEGIWTDQMSDTAIGMFAGYIDSSALGAFPPEENNGFERERSAMPTTDPDRMLAFWRSELERRGLTGEDMSDEPPIGAALLEQVTYELPDCESGDGVDADGTIRWARDYDARYIYILEEGSANPGIPPNFDQPDGVIWRLDVPHEGTPVASGVPYGSLPEGATQAWPPDGSAPPQLTAGTRYHLYALYDVAIPIARCVFEMPAAAAAEEEKSGCSTSGGAGPRGAGLLALLGGLVLGVRRRR